MNKKENALVGKIKAEEEFKPYISDAGLAEFNGQYAVYVILQLSNVDESKKQEIIEFCEHEDECFFSTGRPIDENLYALIFYFEQNRNDCIKQQDNILVHLSIEEPDTVFKKGHFCSSANGQFKNKGKTFFYLPSSSNINMWADKLYENHNCNVYKYSRTFTDEELEKYNFCNDINAVLLFTHENKWIFLKKTQLMKLFVLYQNPLLPKSINHEESIQNTRYLARLERIRRRRGFPKILQGASG